MHARVFTCVIHTSLRLEGHQNTSLVYRIGTLLGYKIGTDYNISFCNKLCHTCLAVIICINFFHKLEYNPLRDTNVISHICDAMPGRSAASLQISHSRNKWSCSSQIAIYVIVRYLLAQLLGAASTIPISPLVTFKAINYSKTHVLVRIIIHGF